MANLHSDFRGSPLFILSSQYLALYIPDTNILELLYLPLHVNVSLLTLGSTSLPCDRKMSPDKKPGNCGMIRGSAQCIFFFLISWSYNVHMVPENHYLIYTYHFYSYFWCQGKANTSYLIFEHLVYF